MNASSVGYIRATAFEIALVSVDRLPNGHRLGVRSVLRASGESFRGVLGLVERQNPDPVAPLVVIGLGERLGPICAVAGTGFDHPTAIGPIPAVEQLDPARERGARVGLAAEWQAQAGCRTVEPRIARLRHRIPPK